MVLIIKSICQKMIKTQLINTKFVIGIMGYKRSGKDTVADYLVNNHNFVKMSIATPLKDTCKLLFNLKDDELNTDKKDLPLVQWNNLTPRELLQFLGTDVMQFKIQEILPVIGRDFWIKLLLNRIESHPGYLVVIPDIRFIHEYETIIEKYGKQNTLFINVLRDTCLANIDTHISENEWLQIKPDLTIYNDSTIDKLYKLVDMLVTTKKN